MKYSVVLVILFLSVSGWAQDPLLGEIKMFAGTFAPRGWAFCDGQLLSIAQNSALFSILGTTYGGDGITTFALPDLRGRAALHAGHGPGLSSRELGEQGGEEETVLDVAQLPPHTHDALVRVDSLPATDDSPQRAYPARNAGATPMYSNSANHTAADSAVVIAPTGGGARIRQCSHS
jgi:microcystin-dependent protein